ncbi:hypothetical protein CHH69_11750 [Terribacillus saccharophilus]|uniref:DUF402 domain-containing protein n=1 Tax=Terribacillus saccharophilus TaxID=361277 RepID=UPI000BA5F3A0|nr:DUF402 domain-containing protein [Terribacillus saccharophilus]PAF35717.1 hypothetical protein CHH69_11750 [Terribacillus saccharophilus]
MNKTIHMKSLKYPDIPHYEWKGHLLRKTPEYVMVLCESGREMKHHTKNTTFTMNVTSLEYFFLKEGYTIAMEIEEGKIHSYYCNIAMPSVLNGNQLSFVDLDLDLVKGRNEDWMVVDEDEFETNSVKYGYPAELKEYALKSLNVLQKKIKAASFPFDGSGLEIVKTYYPL